MRKSIINRQRRGWNSLLSILGGVVALLFVSGCTAADIVTSPVVGKVISVAAKPIFGLAVKDAQTTMTWVEREAEAGRLSDMDADLARQCPEAVLALNELRTQIEEEAKDPEGFKGLIYLGTINRFSQGMQFDLAFYFQQMASSCIQLIPSDRILRIF